MKKLFVLLLGLMMIGLSCEDDTTDTVVCSECEGLFSEILYMWVDNEPVTNPDNPDEKCLSAQFVDYYTYNFDDSLWTPFCDSICGFDYQEGMRYELKIQRKKIDKDEEGNPVYKYCLLQVLKTELVPLKK